MSTPNVNGQLYTLCVAGDQGEQEIALLDLGRDPEFGTMLGMAVYTTPDGDIQRKHLEQYAGTVIAPVSQEDLLGAATREMPTSVYLDGYKIAGSVLRGMLKDALGQPIKNPRIFDSEKIFREENRDA